MISTDAIQLLPFFDSNIHASLQLVRVTSHMAPQSSSSPGTYYILSYATLCYTTVVYEGPPGCWGSTGVAPHPSRCQGEGGRSRAVSVAGKVGWGWGGYVCMYVCMYVWVYECMCLLSASTQFVVSLEDWGFDLESSKLKCWKCWNIELLKTWKCWKVEMLNEFAII